MGLLDDLVKAAAAVGQSAAAAATAVRQQAAAQPKPAADDEAKKQMARKEGEIVAKGLAKLKDISLSGGGAGTAKELRTGIEAFWDRLRQEWENQKEEGYVWTITIDDAVEMNVMGLVKARYDLDLSVSHVGWTMDGVYSGSMDFKFDAALGGLNTFLGALGGRANTNKLGGWFKNDKFVMELTPYNKSKEDAFINTLNYTLEELGAVDDDELARIEAQHQMTDAIMNPMLQNMGSKPDAYELANAPLSYWFDWEYNMTEGDMSQYYSVSGVMGIGGGHGSMNAAGDHVEAHGRAVNPLTGQVFTEDLDEVYHSPFPYVIHAYENGRVTFELHSQKGGPVVVIFRGKIDKIPVGQTVVVPREESASNAAAPSGIEEAAESPQGIEEAPAQTQGIAEAPTQQVFGIEEV